MSRSDDHHLNGADVRGKGGGASASYRSSGKAFLIVCLFAFLLGPGCRSGIHETDRAMGIEPFSTIAKRGIPEAELAEAIAKLKVPATEIPQYWTRIASDSSYSRFHRRCAVFQLFRRHVHVGMRLSELADLLGRPSWLQGSDIQMVEYLGGHIPVRFSLKDTIFVLLVLPDARNQGSAIYLRIAGKIDLQSFRALVLGLGKTGIGNATIEEIGFSGEVIKPMSSLPWRLAADAGAG